MSQNVGYSEKSNQNITPLSYHIKKIIFCWNHHLGLKGTFQEKFQTVAQIQELNSLS